MPVYEYLCTKCSTQYEKREGFDAPAKQKCPSCGGKAQRVIQAAPIVFKGSGFYKTDSRKAPPSEATASADSGSSDSASSGDSPSKNGSSPSESSKGGSSTDTAPATASSD